MNAQSYESFFLRPDDVVQRRYETLRAVVVERQPMKQVAQRFEVSYGTVRNWVSEFCRQWDQGDRSPFLFSRGADVSLKISARKTK